MQQAEPIRLAASISILIIGALHAAANDTSCASCGNPGCCFYYRGDMDWDYHDPTAMNHTFDRAFVVSQLSRWPNSTSIEPRIVFTSGAMGAGKGTMLRNRAAMSNANVSIDLDNFVVVDPDQYKIDLLRVHGVPLQEHSARAGHFHRQSGYLQELVVDAALNCSRNIVVDGSLRNYAWNHELFLRIRRNHPQYRIEILYVYASLSTAKRRAAERPGRAITVPGLVERSFNESAYAVRHLTRLADSVVRIDNEEGKPIQITKLK
ncbi:Zeta toxin domain-containing protein [Plasmodiophora brassicae]